MTCKSRIVIVVPIGACLLLGPVIASAADVSQETVESGRHLASMICSACHVVGRDTQQTTIRQPPAPSFASIVKRPGFSPQKVKGLLLSTKESLGPHGGMPNLLLVEYQVDAITAYLAALRNPAYDAKMPAPRR